METRLLSAQQQKGEQVSLLCQAQGFPTPVVRYTPLNAQSGLVYSLIILWSKQRLNNSIKLA